MADEKRHDDTTTLRVPRSLSGWIASLLAISILPTAGTVGAARSLASLSDKLDAVISRLDKIEGAGTAAKVEDHDRRLRAAEEQLARLQVLVESAKGGR